VASYGKETYSEDINGENEEVKAEGKSHGAQQEGVDPGLHDEQGLVLGERVEGVAHLDGDQDGESHGHGLRGLENNVEIN